MKSLPFLAASAAALVAAAGPTSSSAFAAENPKALMLFSYLGDQAYVRQYNVAKGRAAKIEDVQIDVKSGTARGDVNFFIQEIVNAPAEGYKVIAVNTGSTSKELVSALNEATKQGIKVMSFDGAPPPIDHLTAQVNYDPVGAEREVVQEFVKLVPAGGEIGVIRCIAGLSDTDAFINAFKDAVKDTKLKIVSEGDARCDPEKSRTIAEGMLNAHPDLVALYDIFDVSAQGSLQALAAADSDVVLGSVGGQEYALKAIAGGNRNWKFTVPYPFEVIARTATDTAADLARGKEVEKLVVVPAQPVLTAENAGGMLKTVSDVVAGNVDAVVK
jgi:ribose transport system substrate-binding protein